MSIQPVRAWRRGVTLILTVGAGVAMAAAVPLTANAAVTGSESSLTATVVRHSPSVHARTQIAHTQRLDISYRQFGRGTDLLLVPGFGCTMVHRFLRGG